MNPNLVEPLPAEDPGGFVLAHFGETHDIWHIVTGYGMDEVGDVSLIGFYAAQFEGAPHFAFMLGVVFMNAAFFRLGEVRQRLDALTLGWEAGKTANPLFGCGWNSLWQTLIHQVLESLGIQAKPDAIGEGILEAA